MPTPTRQRCSWVPTSDPLYTTYHDEEWGVVDHDSRSLWETLMLEGFQAGLAWIIVLRKRETFRKAFKNFDPHKVARMTPADVDRLMQDPGIIRARAKIEATINGAKAYLAMQAAGEDFSTFVWSFVDNKPLRNHIERDKPIPAKTDLSEEISKALKKRGFKFVGPTIVYAWMQATGLVDDHTTKCFRHHKRRR